MILKGQQGQEDAPRKVDGFRGESGKKVVLTNVKKSRWVTRKGVRVRGGESFGRGWRKTELTEGYERETSVGT